MGHQRVAVRRQLQAWEQRAGGCWQHSDVGRDLWEVACADCGDDGGPASRQPPAAMQLRGPWLSYGPADQMAARHRQAECASTVKETRAGDR